MHPPPGLAGSREWMKRAMNAGGAFTWNIPRKSIKPTASDPKAWYMIQEEPLKYIKEITDGLDEYVIP